VTTAVEPNDLIYPFDPYGNSAANRILNEYHIITADNSRKYNVLVPLKAPLFANGFKMSASINGGAYFELIYGVHYHFGFEHMSASRKCGKPIFGAVVFVDEEFSGNVRIDRYQTLGDHHTLDAATLSELIVDIVLNPRVTTWEKVLGLPYQFPTIDHEHNVEDLGMSEVVQALDRIGDKIESSNTGGGSGSLPSLEALGLDQVPNLPLATDPISSAANSRNHLMSPYGVRLAITALILQDFQALVARRDNPFEVTAAQTGAPTLQQMAQALANYLPVNGTAANANRLENKSLTEITDIILQGKAADSGLLNGMSVEQLSAAILLGTAANSVRFAGKTYSELLESIQTDSSAGAQFGTQILIPASANLPNQIEGIRLLKARPYEVGGLQDGYFIMTGGNPTGNGETPVWLVRTFNSLPEVDGRYGLEVKELTFTNSNIEFGLYINNVDPVNPGIEVWMRGTSPFDQININVLTKNVFEFIGTEQYKLNPDIPAADWKTPIRGLDNARRLNGLPATSFTLVEDLADACQFAADALKQ